MLSGSKVRTVTGDISVDMLGHVQCHEHIYLNKGPSYESNPALCMDDYERSLKELTEYKNAGGCTIVDAQPGGFGRNAGQLYRLSRESGVSIIAVTGFHKLIFAETKKAFADCSSEQLTRRFTEEISIGMKDAEEGIIDSRAGLVKVAFEENGLAHPIYEKLFRAAAQAAADTGVSVIVHTEKNTDMLLLIRYFKKYGISPERLLICHLDRTNYDVDYHKTVLDMGCMLCYDSVNRTKYVSHEQELSLIKNVCDAGYEEQIVLSLDTTNQRLRSYFASDMGLDYIIKDYVPMLLAAGITETQIKKMCIENAKRILSVR